MSNIIDDVLDFTKENDVKFIKLSFCDIFGSQKNICITSEELPRAFEHGISFDASALKGFMNVEESDLFLFPDPTTLSILPWRPEQGRVVRLFCDIKHPDKTPFEGDGRHILKKAIKKANDMGYVCKIGPECEFYLFELNEKGYPTKIPHDFAGYFDLGPFDRGENVRREICVALDEMGIIPESSHHEQGPGQNEIDFKYSNALDAADNLITFKSIVKSVANRHGLFASFMPKPILDKSGSGLHVNISLFKNGINIFDKEIKESYGIAQSFMAGILTHIDEITAFLNPLTNSYYRLGYFEAPKYITWSCQNRSQLIRIPAAKGIYSRMELRSPDPCCNPYIAFALIINAGLDGIKNNLKLTNPCNLNLYAASFEELKDIASLPTNLRDALQKAKESNFVKSVLPPNTLKKYIDYKDQEFEAYLYASNKETIEEKLYFQTM